MFCFLADVSLLNAMISMIIYAISEIPYYLSFFLYVL
jgi:hypothetical protein